MCADLGCHFRLEISRPELKGRAHHLHARLRTPTLHQAQQNSPHHAFPLSANNFYNQFIDWCREAGLPAGCSPHGLRKAAARRLAEAGCTTHQIAAITGHRSLAEVARYTQAAK
ncbi:tyrosine-type recombinase/integrase [Gluconobacter japonicus]|uniref:tyrosine-type recombinase/integrase n=1 Tax=Gluconobacter japonicus TaxID=376620 RepID=UPI000780C2D4|nr:tyrosine-type recombinase/integrase [Gluconobacter japonicus]